MACYITHAGPNTCIRSLYIEGSILFELVSNTNSGHKSIHPYCTHTHTHTHTHSHTHTLLQTHTHKSAIFYLRLLFSHCRYEGYKTGCLSSQRAPGFLVIFSLENCVVSIAIGYSHASNTLSSMSPVLSFILAIG